MTAFFYPTQADNGREWFASMLGDWRHSDKPFLCFPFMSFTPRTLPQNDAFWMYLYYRQQQTDIDALKGKIKFRVHVVKWATTPFVASTIHLQRFQGGETVWFLCDKGEEIRTLNNTLFALSDFAHRDDKQLSSAIRTSIAPVTFDDTKVKVIATYP